MVARPLHDTVKKDKKWEWTEKQEKAFKELKKRFTEEPVLVAPDINKKNKDGSRCVRLYNRRSIIDGM